jgi:hypothetical protein
VQKFCRKFSQYCMHSICCCYYVLAICLYHNELLIVECNIFLGEEVLNVSTVRIDFSDQVLNLTTIFHVW